MRRAWIESGEAVAVVQQCLLAGVSRATIYAQQRPVVLDESELLHRRLIDEEYTRHPFYGSRRMVVFLGRTGHTVNRKRVVRHEVACRSCSHFHRREPPVSPGESRSLNKERL